MHSLNKKERGHKDELLIDVANCMIILSGMRFFRGFPVLGFFTFWGEKTKKLNLGMAHTVHIYTED